MAGGGNSTGGALPHDAAVALYLSLSLILITARILGEIAMKLNQPAVMGELLAGVLLGKTCLFYISPSFFTYLFGSESKNASALAGVTSICVTLYMLIAGLEMNMKNAMRKKVPSVSVGFFALAVPFGLGFIFCYFFPTSFGLPEGKSVVNFSLFTATAMAITALPVAAKTLRDLHLFRTDLGVVVMSAAVFDDILGWSLFAVTLAVSSGDDTGNGMSIGANIAVSIVYVIFILTAGSFIINRSLPYLQAYFSYPPGELGFVCLFALASSTFALWVGLHNTLGAFVAGAAIGNSRHFRQEMREILDTFVSFMLAPIFFGSVCINANFATDFDAGVVFAILFLSCAGKLLGGFIGAKITGSNMREACAIAACMNARGAMELILAQVARDAGIIDGKVFVALVFMAIVTSVIPGPLLRRILKRPKNIILHSIIPKKGFLRSGGGDSMQTCIRELADALGHPEVADNAIERELTKGSMVWDKVAISSVIAKEIKSPVAGISILQNETNWIGRRSRIESDQEDLVKYVVLLIVPDSNHTIEFDLIKEFSQIFSNVKFREELDKVNSFVELKALLQIEKFRSHMAGHNPNPTPVIALRETGMLAVDVNDIIQGSPMATPAQPDIFLSPKAMNILQSAGMEGVGDRSVENVDFDSLIEFKKRPSRRGTAASVRATIEEYVGPIPDPHAQDGAVNPDGKHTLQSQPEDFGNGTSVRSDKSVSLQTGDSDQANGVTMDERETQTENLAAASIAGLLQGPRSPPNPRGTSPRPNQDDDQVGLV